MTNKRTKKILAPFSSPAEPPDQRGKSSIAIEHYKRAVQIEQSYQKQFEEMYPDRQIFSRLGWDTYRFARRRYRELTGERL